jgi:hypothetical protein
LNYEPVAVVSWVVDLDVMAPPRLPDPATAQTEVAGVMIRQLAVACGCDPAPLVLAAVTGRPWCQGAAPGYFGDVPAPAHVAL